MYNDFIQQVFNRYYPVDKSSLTQLTALAEIQHFKKGELVLPIGKTSKHIYLLYQGAMVSYYINNEGNAYHKNIFLEGDFVGSTVSALTSTPSKFAIEAIEEATVICFKYDAYKALLKEKADMQLFYIAYLEKNWVIDKEQREIDIVLREATDRYIDFITLHPQIETRIPLHYIASHLGITPTQLSRIRKKIKKTS